jgi:hypothetical protein
VAARSNTVPSTAVMTSPNIRSPTVSATGLPAAAWNNARSASAGNRALACDNAAAVTGPASTSAGFNDPSSGHNRPTTPA